MVAVHPISHDIESFFPRDATRGPIPGTPEYDDFIDDQLTIINADYVRSVQKLTPVAVEMFEEVGPGTFAILKTLAPDRPLRVLDICCGVGLATDALVRLGLRIDSLTLTEQDPRIIERAVQYLGDKGHLGPVRKLHTAVFDPNVQSLAECANDEYDLVISCNAFQHFASPLQSSLIRQIHERLGRFGVFVMQTHLTVHQPDWRRSIIEEMKAQMAATGADPAFAQRAVRHVTRFHNFVPLSDIFGWCREAGFSLVDCLFRRSIMGVIGAVK